MDVALIIMIGVFCILWAYYRGFNQGFEVGKRFPNISEYDEDDPQHMTWEEAVRRVESIEVNENG